MTLHIFHNRGERYWEVWLDTEVAPCDGLCVGTGQSYNRAVADAVRELAQVLARLQGPILEHQEFP